MISIHALHYRVRHRIRISFKHHFTTFQSTHSITECDEMDQEKFIAKAKISIHALHYRVRLLIFLYFILTLIFQSTHSITECDITLATQLKREKISIHALHYRVRPEVSVTPTINDLSISIHALHYRVRHQVATTIFSVNPFQSTHSITECDVSL